jgi:aspartate aminotransferase-like enzyme
MGNDYLIFTPGPVKMSKKILEIGSVQPPYFRTKDFSRITDYCSEQILKFVNAPTESKCLFLSSSGTGAMDSILTNLFQNDDEVIILNSGTFGNRFCEMADFYEIKNEQVKVEYGSSISDSDLANINLNNKKAFILQGHETSTGSLHDLNLTGSFCKKNNLLHIVDAITCFLTDELDMQKQNIDLLDIGSQKGLALPPGLSIVVVTPKVERLILKTKSRSYYFDFKQYLRDIKRGQNPFTPPISIIMQLEQRLIDINEQGGVQSEIESVIRLANFFRNEIVKFPLKIFAKNSSNGITALIPTDGRSAKDIVDYFELKYKIFLCPNGGELSDLVFRVSHMGDMNMNDIELLLIAFKKYYEI